MSVVEGWKTGELGELCSIEIGGTPSRSNPNFWDTSKETSNRWVSIRDLNRTVIVDTAEHISDSGVKHSNVKLQHPGTVLLSFKLSIGRVAFAGVPLYTNEAIAGLNSKKIDPIYLFHGLHQWDLLQGVDQAIKGATLNKAKLKKINFQYPAALSEQTKIAEILSTVDLAIEQTEALIVKQQRIKTGLMQDLLTRGIDEHGNLRTEQTHKFKDSPLGRIPVEWEVVGIDEIAKITTGGKDTQDRDESGLYPFFVRSQTIEKINSFSFDGEGVLTAGDGVGVGKVFHYYKGKFDFHQHVYCIHSFANDMDGYFFFHYFGLNFMSRVSQFSAKGSVDSVRMAMIAKMLIPKPLQEEQVQAVEILRNAENLEVNFMETLSKLSLLKTALMQDLLKGKKRVMSLLVSESKNRKNQEEH